jgi:hypothetical protein
MHPMFVKLYLETDADDLLDEERKRRSANRAKRLRAQVAVKTVARTPAARRRG